MKGSSADTPSFTRARSVASQEAMAQLDDMLKTGPDGAIFSGCGYHILTKLVGTLP